MPLWHRYDNDRQKGSIQQADADTPNGRGNLQVDNGLISAVELSLFTHRRAPEGTPLPGAADDTRGWWGDRFWRADFERPDYQIGSLIWLLYRDKITQQTMQRLKDYAEDAVAWMVQDGIIERATAVVTRESNDLLSFTLSVKRPDETAPLWIGPWEVTFSGV